MADPRADDVRRTREIVAEALASGAVVLPHLTEADLCVLGGVKQPMMNVELAMWWQGMSDEERRDLTEFALGFLRKRDLVREPVTVEGEDVELQLVPELALVVNVRKYPSFLVAVEAKALSRGDIPMLFGMRDEHVAGTTLLCQRWFEESLPRLGHRVSSSLINVDAAAELLTACCWHAVLAGARESVGAEVSVLTNTEQAGFQRTGWRFSLVTDGRRRRPGRRHASIRAAALTDDEDAVEFDQKSEAEFRQWFGRALRVPA